MLNPVTEDNFITVSEVVTLKESKDPTEKDVFYIKVPKGFASQITAESVVDELNEDNLHNFNVCLIFTPSTRILKLYPIKEEIYLFKITIDVLTPDFTKDVKTIILKQRLQSIYATGLCFTAEVCLYEVFLKRSSIKIPISELITLFESVRGVNKVTYEILGEARSE